MEIPEIVVEALSGVPTVGALEAVFELTTIGDDRFPHTTFLSRAQLAATTDELRAVVASRRTITNVEREQRATLVTIVGNSAYHLALEALRTKQSEGKVAFAFMATAVRDEPAPMTFEPPQFLVTKEIRAAENWERDSALLEEIARGAV